MLLAAALDTAAVKLCDFCIDVHHTGLDGLMAAVMGKAH
jgi:AhpD family alkylhydroperoxidase